MSLKSCNDILKQVKNLKDYNVSNIDAEWSEFEKLISNNSMSTSNGKESFLWKEQWVAASIALLFFAGYFAYSIYSQPEMLIIQSMDQEKMVELPDGSEVLLGKNSEIKYMDDIATSDVRQVFLNGTATFDVESNPEQPFVVESNGMETMVLGTVFKIDSKKEETLVENIEGKIKVYEKGNSDESFILTEGDKMKFEEGGFSRVEEEKVPVKKEFYYSIDHVLNVLDKKSKGNLFRVPTAPIQNDLQVKLDLDQSVSDIIGQLDKQTALEYRVRPCQDCFDILSILAK